MLDHASLRKRARDAVHSGSLPARLPDRVWGGPGVGEPCPVCAGTVTTTELVLQMDYTYEHGAPGVASVYLHARCFAAWEVERGAA